MSDLEKILELQKEKLENIKSSVNNIRRMPNPNEVYQSLVVQKSLVECLEEVVEKLKEAVDIESWWYR